MRVFFLLTFFILSACEQKGSPSVSLMNLVINGGEYEGKEVIVTGYYKSGLEESALYFSKDQSDYGIIKDAIWVDLDSEVYWQNFTDDEFDDEGRLKSLDGSYLTVEGRYLNRDSDRVGAFGGAITVTRVVVRSKRQE